MRPRRGPKYPGLKEPPTTASEPEPEPEPELELVDAGLELTPHDLKELRRFVRKYGREKIIAEAERIRLPEKRGRPITADPKESREFDENIAECIFKWAEEYRAAGSKKPIDDALHDLYDLLLVDAETQRQPGHYERSVRTIKRRRSRVKRDVESRLALARAKAEYIRRIKRDAD